MNWLSKLLQSALPTGVKWAFAPACRRAQDAERRVRSVPRCLAKAESYHKLLFFKLKIVSRKSLPCSV